MELLCLWVLAWGTSFMLRTAGYERLRQNYRARVGGGAGEGEGGEGGGAVMLMVATVVAAAAARKSSTGFGGVVEFLLVHAG